MEQNDEMNTVLEVINKLAAKGYDNEFRWSNDKFCTKDNKCYAAEDLVILKTYRFEGMSDPSDMSILYLIKANDGMIGYSLDAYGAYSDHDDEGEYDNFIRKIPVKDHEEQMIFEL